MLVGMADPTDLFAYDELARVLKRDIEPRWSAESAAAADHRPRLPAHRRDQRPRPGARAGPGRRPYDRFRRARRRRRRAKKRRSSSCCSRCSRTRRRCAPPTSTSSRRRHRLQIRFRIDGVLHAADRGRLEDRAGAGAAPEADVGPRHLREAPAAGRPLQRRRCASSAVDVRISTMPTQYGESVVMRLLNQSSGAARARAARHAGRHAASASARSFSAPSGMVLVTGPDRQRQDHDAVRRAERAQHARPQDHHGRGPGRIPPARHQPGAGATRRSSSPSRACCARRCARIPDVILVGEMRDQETAQIGLRAAMTGHMVLSTLHTNDAASTPMRLLDMGAPRYMVAHCRCRW